MRTWLHIGVVCYFGPGGLTRAVGIRYLGFRFERDQSVSPGSHLPSSPPMGSPSTSASMMGLGDHRRELSVLQTPSYIRNSPSSGPGQSPAGTAHGFPSATTPISALSINNGSHGFLNGNIFDSYQSDLYQNSSQYRPGTAPGPNGSTSSTTIGPDSYFPNPQDDRRPSVASLATNASSTGSKTSIGRSIIRRIRGDDDKESPGSSDSSLLQNNVLQRPSAAYSRTNTQTGSRPQTPVPSSDVVPFLYQDPQDIPKYGEAPVRQQPVMASMRYDGSDETDQKSSSSYRSHFKRKKDKVDKDKELPPPPNYKNSAPNKEHRKELAKIDGISMSQNSSQSRLGDRPSSPTPSIASSLSNNVPKSPGPHQHKKFFLGFIRKKGKGEDNERSETPQPAKTKNQKPEPLQLSGSPYNSYDAQTPKRGSASGVGSSVTVELYNYTHPRAYEYAAIEPRKNTTGGPQAHGKMKAMKRGYSSNDTSVAKKLGGFGRSKGEEEKLFLLDTDLRNLVGVVSTGQDMTPPSGKIPTAEEALKGGNLSGVPESLWRVPDSWRWVPEAGTVSRSESVLDNNPEIVETSGNKPQQKSSSAYCIRVFRADSTFATLSCDLSSSVSEVLRLLGRKSFLQDDLGNYQLIIKKGDFSRILQPQERPLQIQKRLLEQAGYTQYDHLEEIGREDHSYLCRFTFRMSKIGGCSLVTLYPSLI